MPYSHDANKTYFSALTETGLVNWDRRKTTSSGAYDVVYPDIRWKSLRNILGWSVLQHHSVVHTTVTIDPPKIEAPDSPHLAFRVDLKQASFVAFSPRDSHVSDTLHWLEGDIYAQSPIVRLIPLPSHIPRNRRLVIDIFIVVDYEIRLFGDPVYTAGQAGPVSRVKFSLDIVEMPEISAGPRQIVPDFVDGIALGEAIGLELQNGGKPQLLSKISCNQPVGMQFFVLYMTVSSTTYLRPSNLDLIMTRSRSFLSNEDLFRFLYCKHLPCPHPFRSCMWHLNFHQASLK